MSEPQCSRGWKITGYYTPLESDYPSVKMRRIRIAGRRYSFPSKFIDAVRMEGWGRTVEGWCVGFYGRRYHRTSEPKDSRGRNLVIGMVAVDPRLIERGTKLTIHGIPAINGDNFVAMDVGGMINEKHIDVYCGEGLDALRKTWKVTKENIRVCVHP